MTRRVRSGNTQKHKKMPGEATKWGEFDLQKSSKSSPEKRQKMKNESGSKQRNKLHHKISNFSKGEDVDLTESHTTMSSKNIRSSFEEEKANKKIKLENCGADEVDISRITDFQCVTPASKLDESPNKVNSVDSSFQKSPNDEINKNANEEQDSVANSKQNKAKLRKKEMYLKKLKAKRAKDGVTLLSSKAERKLYLIKKKLREKDVPVSTLKEIIRKERRKEELKFRRMNNPSKLCFNCRQPGHFLAGCPQKVGSSNQETGICFKCGSDGHTSSKCPDKIQGFPFAKCFICKEQGHISKDCPSNTHGVYPKGGSCTLCGNVNHLRKDCPSLNKKAKAEEQVMTLHTINKETSIDDDDDEEMAEIEEKLTESTEKPKIVKF